MQILQDFNEDGLFTVKLKKFTSLGLRPGDLIRFDYDGERLGLVVSSKRGPGGSFLSSRSNHLLNVFQVDDLSPSMFRMMINILYKDRARCTYNHSSRILGAFLKNSNFRTFMIKKIQHLDEVMIRNVQ